MENQDVFTGKMVRLVAADLEADCKLLAEWDRDSEYQRLLNHEKVHCPDFLLEEGLRLLGVKAHCALRI